MKIFFQDKQFLVFLIPLILILLCIPPVHAATTGIHIVKYASDKTTILAEKNLTYQEMRDTLPVFGDGSTHYYHQGPVFLDDADAAVEQQLRWNPEENTNVMDKDMGAVMGTSVKDLCDLAGGMSIGDTVVIKSSDGMSKEFAYKNVYSPPSRQGPMVITWSCSGIASCAGAYPDTGYSDGMRLVFFADTSVNPWGAHVFGNYDWHESADKHYWYFYNGDGGELYPTTTGVSMKYVSEILIYSSKSAASSSMWQAAGGGSASRLPGAGSEIPADISLYGYQGKLLSTAKSGILNGSLQMFFEPDAEPVVVYNRAREFTMNVNLPPESNVTLARLYVYISGSHNLQTMKGTVPSVSATLNTQHLEEVMAYFDTVGEGARDLAATYAYDVLPLLRKNGTYLLSIRNPDFEQSLFMIDGVLLVTGYENKTAPAIRYWISEGCDAIASVPEKGLFPDECKTDSLFPGKVTISRVQNGDLYLFSTGLDHNSSTEHTVKFNKGIWPNIFDNATVPGFVHLPVTKYVNETGNTATIESSIRSQDADSLLNRNAILIVEYNETDSSASGTAMPGYVQEESSHVPESSPGMNESRCCRISLDSDPEGALVYLDNTYTGKTTPSVLEVPEGDTHTVRFELDGYVPSVTGFTATNSTSIRPSLYAPVHSTKNRLADEPEDPDGTRYGGLYIYSRPRSATITINGISTGKVTPALFIGLEAGRYTVKLGEVQDLTFAEKNLFEFPDQTVWVLPEMMTLVDINGIGHHIFSDIIIDSHQYRGLPFTVSGYVNNKTIPAQISTPLFDSFITIHENESLVSYRLPVPYTVDEDRYLLFEPREHQDLSLTVTSTPQGAEVIIDGFRTGFATPYTFGNISDGPHRVTVTKAGYLPQESLLDLRRQILPVSPTGVDFYLEEYPSGFLYVRSIPPGGRVSIDGMDTGEVTPALFKSLPTGAHDVKVTGTNSSKLFYDVTINSLNMVELSENFTELRDT